LDLEPSHMNELFGALFGVRRKITQNAIQVVGFQCRGALRSVASICSLLSHPPRSITELSSVAASTMSISQSNIPRRVTSSTMPKKASITMPDKDDHQGCSNRKSISGLFFYFLEKRDVRGYYIKPFEAVDLPPPNGVPGRGRWPPLGDRFAFGYRRPATCPVRTASRRPCVVNNSRRIRHAH